MFCVQGLTKLNWFGPFLVSSERVLIYCFSDVKIVYNLFINRLEKIKTMLVE